ncbi:hypothetical protein JCM8208_003042 [Rhodotorula glutinis]
MSSAPFQSQPSLTFLALVTARALAGASALVAPLALTPYFGVSLNPSASFIARLFGARDLLLAAGSLFDVEHLVARGQLVRASGAAARTVVTLAMVIDAIDVVSGLVEYNRGTIGRLGLVVGAGGASVFVAIAASLLRQ